MTNPRSSKIKPADDLQISDAKFRMLEAAIYLSLSISLGASSIANSMKGGKSFLEALLDFGPDAILYGLPVIAIILFHMIYGQLPVEMLRKYLQSRNAPKSEKNVLEITPAELYEQFTRRSAKVADSLFRRAGTYLLIGGIVAIGAALSFYIETSAITKEVRLPLLKAGDATTAAATDFTRLLVELAPRASLLVFLELVAFYFLRQYRVAMDEYRYYEEIQRKREEVTVSLTILARHGGNDQILENLKSGMLSSQTILKEGETNAILESKKLERGELDVLKSIVEAIGSAKK